MDATNPSRQRDIMFCHSCENEWYRDEHGLTCPECQSDFCEIIEADNDPRGDEQHIPADTTPHTPGEFYAPDPDEDDIDNLRFEETGPGTYRLRGTYRTEIPMGGQQGEGQQGQGGPGGLMGMLGSMIQGAIGGQQQQLQQQARQNAAGRPPSAPGSPEPGPEQPQQQPRGGEGNGTWVRHGHGPGFSYTIATSSNRNFGAGGGLLLPRNANGPQPFVNQPEDIERMLNQMIANIGVAPGMPGDPGGFHDHNDMHPGFGGPQAPPPFMFGGGGGVGGPPGRHPFANFLEQLMGPPGGIAGDAVYTQEALDRIMTQLMEQHQTGNAPGPATEAAIAALPTKTISKADQGESGKAECSICMDEVALATDVTVLPCQHWFHHECIKAWLSEHDTCPHCRQGIMPKEGGEGGRDQPRSPNQAPLHDMRSPEYTRPAGMPGAFPFPRENSADSQSGPRRSSTQRSSGGGGGVFGRMRDAFGRSGSSSGGGGGNGGGSENRG